MNLEFSELEKPQTGRCNENLSECVITQKDNQIYLKEITKKLDNCATNSFLTGLQLVVDGVQDTTTTRDSETTSDSDMPFKVALRWDEKSAAVGPMRPPVRTFSIQESQNVRTITSGEQLKPQVNATEGISVRIQPNRDGYSPKGDPFFDSKLNLDGMRGATIDFYHPPQTIQGPDGFKYARVDKMSWMQEARPAPANNGQMRFDQGPSLPVGDLSARQAYAVPEQGKELYAIFKDGVPVGYVQHSSFEALVNSLNPPSRAPEVNAGVSAQFGSTGERNLGSSVSPGFIRPSLEPAVGTTNITFSPSDNFSATAEAWNYYQYAGRAIESGTSPAIERLRVGDMLVKEIRETGPVYKEADKDDIEIFNQVLEGESNRNRAVYLVLPGDWRESYASLSRSQRDRVSQNTSMEGVARTINEEVAANNIYDNAVSNFNSNVKSPPIALLSENQRLVVSFDEKGRPITVAATPDMVRQFNQELNGNSNRVRAAWLGLDAKERDTFMLMSTADREQLVDRSRDFESLRRELPLTAGLNAPKLVVDYQVPQLPAAPGTGPIRTGSDPEKQYPGDIRKTFEPDEFYHVEPVGDKPLRPGNNIDISQPSGFGDHNKPILPDWAETALPPHFPASAQPEMPDDRENIELDPNSTKHDAFTSIETSIDFTAPTKPGASPLEITASSNSPAGSVKPEKNQDFRIRIQEGLVDPHSPVSRSLSELANTEDPERWLQNNEGTDQGKYIEFRHHLERVKIVLEGIEKHIPELALDTPAARRLARQLETAVRNTGEGPQEALRVPDYISTPQADINKAVGHIIDDLSQNDKFIFDGPEARFLARKILHDDLSSLHFQVRDSPTDRPLESIEGREVSLQIDPNYVDSVRALKNESDRTGVPLSELLKNMKIADYGFRDQEGETIYSKISLVQHDLIDHIYVLSKLKEEGLLDNDPESSRGYGKLLGQLGGSIERDAFSRESELIASASYNTRAFNLSNPNVESPVTIKNLVENLRNSSTLNTSENQLNALRAFEELLKEDPTESSIEARRLRFVYSAVTEELSEQTRKTDRSVLISPQEMTRRIQVANPEYIALIFDVERIASSSEAKQINGRLNLATENYLRTDALKKPPEDFSVSLTRLRSPELAENANSVPPEIRQWLLQYPDYSTRRAPVGR